MTWWSELGYPPFEKGRDGFPNAAQVVKYYREHHQDQTGRAWSQKDLAQHLKITEHAVRDIERGAVGIDYERRHFLCPLLDIPPILCKSKVKILLFHFLRERYLHRVEYYLSVNLVVTQLC